MRLLEYADEAMKGLDAQEEARTLPTLPDPVRVIWVLQSLSFEVMMGSFLAYFMNSAGIHSGTAIEALNEIGAGRMASVLQRAAKSVEVHRDAWEGSKEELDTTAELYDVASPYAHLPNADELIELTQEFRQAEEDDDWGDLLDAYLKRSVAKLAESSTA